MIYSRKSATWKGLDCCVGTLCMSCVPKIIPPPFAPKQEGNGPIDQRATSGIQSPLVLAFKSTYLWIYLYSQLPRLLAYRACLWLFPFAPGGQGRRSKTIFAYAFTTNSEIWSRGYILYTVPGLEMLEVLSAYHYVVLSPLPKECRALTLHTSRYCEL